MYAHIPKRGISHCVDSTQTEVKATPRRASLPVYLLFIVDEHDQNARLSHQHKLHNTMPSSSDSSSSSVEIIPRSTRAITKDDTIMGGSPAVTAATALSATVAEFYPLSLREQCDVVELCRKHRVMEAYTALLAGERRTSMLPPEGAVCVYVHALEAGMLVPLHGFFSETLNYFRLAPSQIAPNGWRILQGFVVLCHHAGVPSSLALLRHFFPLCKYQARDSSYTHQPSMLIPSCMYVELV
jgi:hypothetical protein